MSRARIFSRYKSSLGGPWTHQWIDSQHDPNADQSGIFALHNVDCLLRNAEPGDEHVPPELLRYEFATYVSEGLMGCHAATYFRENEEVIRRGYHEKPVYAGMKRRRGLDDEQLPKEKVRRLLGKSETLETIVVEVPESRS